MKIFLFIGLITIGFVKSQVLQCPPTGIHALAIPGSCQRWVRCITGNSMPETCAPGLYFDVVLGQCNTQAAANCNPCRDNPPGELRFYRDPFLCGRFSLCIGASLTENTCGEGLHFDLHNTRTCVPQGSTDCSPDGGAPPPDDGDDGDDDDEDDQDYGPGVEATCNLDSNFEILASPLSCGRHIICTCGHANIRTCPSGLVFDVITQSCNTREQGRCLSESMQQCPDSTSVLQLAHPHDCRYYVLCIRGTATLQACAAGLEVNRKTNRCDFPHIAQCTSQTALTYAQLMTGMLFI